MSGMRIRRRRLIPVAVTAIAAAAVALPAAGLGTSGPGTSGAGSLELTSAVALSGSAPGSTVPATGTPSVSPAAGVHTSNFCGSDWKNVRPGGGTGYNIYNYNFGAETCVGNSNNAGFGISYSSVNGGYEAFPNISSGWQWGIAPLHGYYYPVKEKDDGHPESSVSVNLVNAGIYNAAYDMWFSTYKQTDGQDNGAEVMIWLSCRYNCIGAHSPIVKIEGVEFREDQWIMDHNGVRWDYTAFVALTHRSHFSKLWLNPFYQAAGVDPNWYLTSIDFGFELVDGGQGLRVNSYSLTGVK
jgi:Glycosyl hydrolase family 12